MVNPRHYHVIDLLESRNDIKREAYRASWKQWRNEGKSSFFQSLYHPSHIPIKRSLPEYLLYDSPSIAIIRSRIRFDRHQLRECAYRHGGVNYDVKDDICPYRCRSQLHSSSDDDDNNNADAIAKDNINHYFFECSHFNSIRTSLFGSLFHPSPWLNHPKFPLPQPYQHDMNQCIIAFTDGSCYKDNRGGAAALVSFPSINTSRNRFRFDNLLNNQIDPPRPQLFPFDNNNPLHYFPSRSNNWYSHSISIDHSTNNISELYAIYIAIELISTILNHIHSKLFSSLPICFVTDSSYVCN